MDPRITRLWQGTRLSFVGVTYRKSGRVVLVTIRRDILGGWLVKSGELPSAWAYNLRRAFAIARMYATVRLAIKNGEIL